MNHSEAVSTVTSLMRRFPAEGVAPVLTKYARSHDLAPAQLAKLGTTYNTISSLSTYEKSQDRGANAHQIDVGALVAGYADKPMRKAASSDPLSTHGEHVDLYNMFRQTLHDEREQMPDEHDKDEKREEKPHEKCCRQHGKPNCCEHRKDEEPDSKFLKEAAEDLDNTLDVQALNILRLVKKEAGVYDLSYADEDARHMVDGRFVDAAMRRISAHAAGMTVAARVIGMRGSLEKRAFSITSPIGNLLADMAFNVAALDTTVRMHKEAEKKRRPESAGTPNLDPTPAEPRRDGGGEPPREEEYQDSPAYLEESAVHAARSHEAHSRGEATTDQDWRSTPASETAIPKSSISKLLAAFGGSSAPEQTEEAHEPGLFGGMRTGTSDKTVAKVEEQHPDDEPNAQAEDTDETAESRVADAHSRTLKPRPQGDHEEKTKRTGEAKETRTAGKSAPHSSTSSETSKGTTPGDFLRHALSLPAAGVGYLQQALVGAAAATKQHISSVTSAPRQNTDQMRVDRSVDDIRRAFILRKVMHNDHVLREADPQKVTKYYNELANAYPDLAVNPESLTLALREAVAYDGIPPETIKNLTSTRLDAARAHNEETNVRANTYRI